MKTINSTNPYNDKIILRIKTDSSRNISEKIMKLNTGYKQWYSIGLHERLKILNDVINIIRKQKNNIAKIINEEVGRPYHESLVSIDMLLSRLEFFINIAPEYLKDESISVKDNVINTITYEPRGTVGVISTWNYPFNIPFWSIFPALIIGNSVLFKPSEKSILCGLKIAEIMSLAGVPKNVFSIVVGTKKESEFIVKNHGIQMISFTGSYPTGKTIYKNSSVNIKKLVLELGGNDSMIVLGDANIENCISSLVWAMIKNSGQACNAVRKVFVHKNIYPVFIDFLKRKLDLVKYGNPQEENIQVGPLKDKSEILKIKAMLKKNKPKIIYGGIFSGNVLQPTIIQMNNEEIKAQNKEFFAPIIFINKFSSLEKTIRTVNSYDSGLTSSVWTANIKLGYQIAKEIDSFTVGINMTAGTVDNCPWGGRKKSGLGYLFTKGGFLQFANIKNIRFNE